MIYAGIGSRKTPDDMILIMQRIGKYLHDIGATLRSGGAIGADTAFEWFVPTNKSIIYANDATSEAIELASKFHPAWEVCSDYSKKLLGRNAMIILGDDLKTPVDFVVCWTPDENSGGTGLGLKIAKSRDIPIFNLFKDGAKEKLKEFLRGELAKFV